METLRTSLINYAYNIIGSYEDAKDIVQDTMLKFTQLDKSKIEDERLYLIRMVINLAIDRKRKLKRQTDYPGAWLPEPVATEVADQKINNSQILSYAMMVLLEKLDSKERAVFILKEAFDYNHHEISKVLEISEENSRKILSRAKSDLRADSVNAATTVQTKILDRYLSVIQNGEISELEKLLHDEVNVVSDGGGKATAFRNIIQGINSVGRLLMGLYKKSYRHARIEGGLVNHQPAIFYFVEDKLVTCQILSTAGEKIENVFFIRNPDKLSNLQKD